MESGSQLLLTKLYLPPPRADLVTRPRLIEQISAGLQGMLTLISAPAGFGKTSLFSAWRASPAGADPRLAWLSLDTDDNEPMRFLHYLTSALDTALPDAFDQVMVLFHLPQPPTIKTVLANIINCLAQIRLEGAGEPFIVALDDYHVLEDRQIHEAVEYLLDHLPPHVHLVILSRSDPPLRLARLRARGQLTEIVASDLRFTRDEAAAFLNDVMHLALPLADVAVLDARTEGWVAGLKLAALRLSQPGLERQEAARFIQTFGTNHRFAAEFLVEEVVSRQPVAVQEFLLRSSVLERMCAPLCDALGRAVETHAPATSWPSEDVIEHLVRRNIFIVPLDEDGYWYRYHHLFRDLLRARLAKLQPTAAPILHRAASAWYEQQGLLKEAVRHAILTQDWDYAADMVERHGAATLGRGDLRMLGEWCEAFPEAIMSRRPTLCIFHAWVLLLSYSDENMPGFAARLTQAEQALTQGGVAARAPLAPGKPPVSVAAWVMGNIIQLRAAYMLAPSYAGFDAQELIQVAEQSMKLLTDAGDGVTDSVNFLNFAYAYMALPNAAEAEKALAEARRRTIAGHNFFGGTTAIYYQACLALCQGRFDHVERICHEGRSQLAGASGFRNLDQELPPARSLSVAAGWARLEVGDLNGAELALSHALEVTGWAPWVELHGHLALARLRRIQRDDAGFVVAVRQIERLGLNGRLCAAGLRVLDVLRTAPLDGAALKAARDWTTTVHLDLSKGPPLGMKPTHNVLAYATYLTWAHVMVLLGESRSAFVFTQPALATAQREELLTRVIELSLVEALGYNLLGENRRTRDALERALAAAEAGGHVRTFDQGDQIKGLLAEAAARGLRRRQIRGLLDALGWPAERRGGAEIDLPAPVLTAHTTSDALAEPLTEREQEILSLVAGGLSNAEIAAKLYIGIGTVKTHINHLFGKLEVSSRTQLLARARMLGLLP